MTRTCLALLLLMVAGSTPLAGADLGSDWTQTRGAGGDIVLSSQGTLPPYPAALLIGPTLWARQVTLDGAPILSRSSSDTPSATGYSSVPLPAVPAGGSHRLIVDATDSTLVSARPYLALVPADDATAREVGLNLLVVMLREFSGLASLLLAVLVLLLLTRERTRELLLLGIALPLNALSELAPSLLASFLGVAAAQRLSVIGLLLTGVLLLYYAVETSKPSPYLQFLPFALVAALAAALALSGSSPALVEWSTLAVKAIFSIAFAVLASIAASALARTRLSKMITPIFLGAVLSLSFAAAVAVRRAVAGPRVPGVSAGSGDCGVPGGPSGLRAPAVPVDVPSDQPGADRPDRKRLGDDRAHPGRQGAAGEAQRGDHEAGGEAAGERPETVLHHRRPHRVPGGRGRRRDPRGGQGEGYPRLHEAGGRSDHQLQSPDPGDAAGDGGAATSAPSSSERRSARSSGSPSAPICCR